MPSKLNVDWDEIRRAAESGVDDITLSEQFGVKRVSIRQQRRRYKWLTPAKIEQEAIMKAARDKARQIGNQSVTRVTLTAQESAGAKLLADGERASVAGMEILLQKLLYAVNHPESIAALKSVQDVASAAKTARVLAGMDKPASTLNFNFGGWAQPETREAVGEVIEVKECD